MHTLIFDIDGTLTQSNEADSKCFLQALKRVFNIESIDTNWSNYTHVTDEGIIRELLPDLPEAELESFKAEFFSLLDQQPASSYREVPGATAFLESLAAANYPVAMATGAWRESAKVKLRHAGIDRLNLPLASSTDEVSRTGIMNHALNLLNPDHAKSITYFGDGPWDMKATSEAGWNFIGIGNGISQLRSLGAKHTFPDYTNPDRIFDLLSELE